MKASVGVAMNVIMALVFVGAIVSALEWPLHSRAFVLAIAIPGLILTMIHFIREGRRARSDMSLGTPSYADTPLDADVSLEIMRRRTLNVSAWILGLFSAIWMVGFEIAVPLFTFSYLKFQARESLLMSGLFAGFMIALIVGVFDLILHVLWPKGVLQTWLGL
jgi:hypothetical protein